MKAQNVKVTTTSGFEGIQIEEYLEPITAHVVVGMNFFKDFLSGFSDFFGGKSRTYQNTLSSINEEVINELRKKAYSIGGNCVLSLKIDNDEVSAQGKSMMMVTALGTAARANFSIKSINIENEKKSNRISIDYFNLINKKKQYIKESEEGSIRINDSFWEFVKKNKVYELSDYILNKYVDFIETGQEYDKEKLNGFSSHTFDYFSIIDSNIAINCLYNKLNEDLSTKVRNRIIKIITEIKLVDYSKIIDCLKHSEFYVQKTGIELARFEKQSYEKSDIKLIDNAINLITNNFPQRGEKTTKKKMLSSKEKEIWICECGNENNGEEVYCSNCHKDIFGFGEREAKPKIVVEQLINTMEILKATIE